MKRLAERLAVLALAALMLAGCMASAGCVRAAWDFEREVLTTESDAVQLNLVTGTIFGTSSDMHAPRDSFSPEAWQNLHRERARAALSAARTPISADGSERHVQFLTDPYSYTAADLHMMRVRQPVLPNNLLWPFQDRPVQKKAKPEGPQEPKWAGWCTVTHIQPRQDGWGITSRHATLLNDLYGAGEAPKTPKAKGEDKKKPPPTVADEYAAAYRKAFQGTLAVRTDEVQEKGARWVFRRDLPSVWGALMEVVCQYHGVLALSETEDPRLVVCRKIISVPPTKGYKGSPCAVALLAIVAKREGPDLTSVSCAPLDADGRVVALSSREILSGRPREGARDVSMANYLTTMETSRNAFSSFLTGPTKDRPKGIDASKGLPGEVVKANLQAISVHRFYQELGLQLFAVPIWEQKYLVARPPGASPETGRAAALYERLAAELRKKENIPGAYAEAAETGGDAFGQSVLSYSVQVVSPRIEAMLGTIVERLMAGRAKVVPGALTLADSPVRVYLLASPDVNAFAVPDGRVFVCAGLLDVLDTDEEVAAVMAHELGHVIYQDIAGRLVKQTRDRQTWEAIGLGLQVIAGVAGPIISVASVASAAAAGGVVSSGSYMTAQLISNVAQGVALGVTSAAGQLYVSAAAEGFSEKAELRADKFALACLSASGYKPDSMIAVLEMLQDQQNKSKSQSAAQQERMRSSLVNAEPGVPKRLDKIKKVLGP